MSFKCFQDIPPFNKDFSTQTSNGKFHLIYLLKKLASLPPCLSPNLKIFFRDLSNIFYKDFFFIFLG